MRTSGVRGLARRELRGLLDGRGSSRDVLVLDGIERIAASVAARTDDAETAAAVYVFALLRYGGWDRERLAQAGIAPRLIQIGDATRRHSSQYHRFSYPVVARAELIRTCLREISGATPKLPKQKAEERALRSRADLAAANGTTVRRLIADLESPDEDTWWYAVMALGYTRPTDAVEPLLAAWERLYRSADAESTQGDRTQLQATARRLMTEAHLPLALRLVEHEDPGLSRLAAEFLRTVDDPAARSAAMKHEIESIRDLREPAATSTPPTRLEDVTALLVKSLTESPGQRRVIQAVGRLGDRSCLPALTKSLGWRVAGSVQTSADRAIRAIGGKQALSAAVLEVLRDPEANTKRAAYLAGRLRLTAAIPDLIAIVQGSRVETRAAAASLAALGATQAAPAIAQALRPVPAQNWPARVSLIESLLQLDPEPAVDALIEATRHPRTRDIAMNALARCSDPEATALVATVIMHGVIRMELVRPLADRGDPGLVDVLIHVINTANDLKIRQVATRGILEAAQVDPGRVIEAQSRFLHHSVRAQTALAWLEGRLAPLRERHQLHELARASKDQNERVRAQAVKSLALIATPTALEIIRTLRHDPSRHVRACVAGVLPPTERPAAAPLRHA